MGNVFLYRMPSGIPGAISHQSQCTVEAHMTDGQFSGYGVFGKFSPANGKFVPLEAADTAVYGLIVRAYPTQSAINTFGSDIPQTGVVQDVLRRGYMTVKCNAGNAKAAQPVHVRIGAPTQTKLLGGIEAVADGANTIELKNAIFMHDADAQGNVEISFNV